MKTNQTIKKVVGGGAPMTYIPLLKYRILNAIYDPLLVISGLGAQFRKRITEHAHIQEDERVILDVGCGTGMHLKVLASRYPEKQCIGIDPDSVSIEKLSVYFSHKSQQPKLICGTASLLPLSDASVDLCFSTLTFHHLSSETKNQAFREIHRVLRPNGRFILIDWGVLSSPFSQIFHLFEHQEFLIDHREGRIPDMAHTAGFELLSQNRLKPSGIWMWQFEKH